MKCGGNETHGTREDYHQHIVWCMNCDDGGKVVPALILAADGYVDIMGMSRALAVLCTREKRDPTSINDPLDEPNMLTFALHWDCEKIWDEGMVWGLNLFETYASEPLPHDPNPQTVRVVPGFHPRPELPDKVLGAWALAQTLVARGIAHEVLLSGEE